MCEVTGYKPRTTFWEDFSIAEFYGTDSIKNTYKKIFNEWNSNYIYLTELTMVLNWKVWYWHEQNGIVADIYNKLYRQTNQFATEMLKGNELIYFLRTVD